MPAAIDWPLTVAAGSYEPQYITITDPDTGGPVDLTAPGWEVTCVVATRPDGTGTVLLTLPDGVGSVWRRTSTGRIYFEPPATVSAGWVFRRGHHQVELQPPAGPEFTVRVAAGTFHVSPELVITP